MNRIEEFHTADSNVEQECASDDESNDLLWSNSSEFTRKMTFWNIFIIFMARKLVTSNWVTRKMKVGQTLLIILLYDAVLRI